MKKSSILIYAYIYICRCRCLCLFQKLLWTSSIKLLFWAFECIFCKSALKNRFPLLSLPPLLKGSSHTSLDRYCELRVLTRDLSSRRCKPKSRSLVQEQSDAWRKAVFSVQIELLISLIKFCKTNQFSFYTQHKMLGGMIVPLLRAMSSPLGRPHDRELRALLKLPALKSILICVVTSLRIYLRYWR